MNARFDRMKKDLDLFCEYLLKLEPQEWLGVARILGAKTGQINPATNKTEPINAEKIFEDMLEAFLKLSKKRRKTLLDIIKKAIK